VAPEKARSLPFGTTLQRVPVVEESWHKANGLDIVVQPVRHVLIA